MGSFLLFLLAFPQDSDLPSRLRTGGWAAVDELSAKPAAREKLAELAAGSDAELAWWAGAALSELEAREKAGASWAPPLRVTLEAKDRPAHEIVKALLEKASLRLTDPPGESKRISVSFRDAPLLEALRETGRKGGLKPVRHAGGRFALVEAQPVAGPAFDRGTFGVSIASMAEETAATFQGPPASRLDLVLALEADPRERLIDEEAECRIVAAADDSGRSLLPDGRSLSVRSKALLALVSLGSPAKGARKISLLRGELTQTILSKEVEIVFEDLLGKSPQSKEEGGVKAVLEKFGPAGSRYHLDLSLFGAGPYHHLDFGEITLEDADGRAWRSRQEGHFTGKKLETQLGIVFERAGEEGPPARLRVPVVTGAYPRRIPFEFRDVALR